MEFGLSDDHDNKMEFHRIALNLEISWNFEKKNTISENSIYFLNVLFRNRHKKKLILNFAEFEEILN